MSRALCPPKPCVYIYIYIIYRERERDLHYICIYIYIYIYTYIYIYSTANICSIILPVAADDGQRDLRRCLFLLLCSSGVVAYLPYSTPL